VSGEGAAPGEALGEALGAALGEAARALKGPALTLERLDAVAERLRGAARAAEAGGRLTPALAERLGRWAQRATAAREGLGAPPPLRALLIGQVTTRWLALALSAEAFVRGAWLVTDEGGYDAPLQSSLAAAPADVALLAPWPARLVEALAAPAAPERARALAEEEAGLWRAVWGHLAARGVGRVVQLTCDAPSAGAAGDALARAPGGALHALALVNDLLRAHLPAGAQLLDLGGVAGELGRRAFYDARRYHWTKQPFSEEGALALARAAWAAARALLWGPKKCLVLDLDNTLWGGVVGEDGAAGVRVGGGADGEAFLALQRHCKALATRGVLLAACSKNSPEDARAPFEARPEMALALSDFASFEASWDPKPEALRRVARALNVGLDALVFVDDNPAERAAVRALAPEVEVVELPADPAGYVAALEAGRWFEAAALTREDLARGAQYQAARAREESQARFADVDSYLESLQMVAEVRAVEAESLERVTQLLGKTNQFNLTTRRHGRAAVEELCARPRAVSLAVSVRDAFGDHGLVGVLLAAPHPDDGEALVVDTWLMSCRVMARTVEHLTFGVLLARAAALGYARLVALYRPTPKNAPVADLLPALGMAPCAPPPGAEPDARAYALSLAGASPPPTRVRLAPAASPASPAPPAPPAPPTP